MFKNILSKILSSRFFPIALIIALGWFAYANCLGNEMFWDDDDFILKNRYIKDFSFWPLWFKENLVAGSYFVSNYWRPLLLTVFTIEWHLWKDWVYGWHFVSVNAHILVGILIYFLFKRLFNHQLLACVVAILFVIHPVHNEAVVYVNSLGDSLASIFVISALICFARFRQSQKNALTSRSYYLSLLFFPLAVFSKETGFVLCALLPWMDFFMLNTKGAFTQRLKKTLAVVWPLITMAIIYVVLRGTILNFSNSFNFYNEDNPFTTNIFLRILTFFKAATQYAGFLFIPYELRVERQMPWAQSLFEWDVLWGGFLIGILLWLLFKSWQKHPAITFLTGWFFIAIVPASNVLVPINSTLYEHFLYLPMVGIMGLCAYFIINKLKNAAHQQTALKIFILIIIIFIAINIKRNTDWKTAINFYEIIVKYSPNYRVINNLGMEYADKGIHDKAEFWYRRAIAMDPKNAVAYHNLAGTLRDTGRLPEAEQNFKQAIALDPKFIFSYRALAELYWRTGNFDESYRYLTFINQFDPTDQNIIAAMKELESR